MKRISENSKRRLGRPITTGSHSFKRFTTRLPDEAVDALRRIVAERGITRWEAVSLALLDLDTRLADERAA